MTMTNNSTLLVIFVLAILVCGLVFVEHIQLGNAQVGTQVSHIITQDATWTKEGSPYTFVGNVLVDNGVTLTIEPGIKVNLNNYLFMINGTLRVLGSDAEQINFNSGSITFTSFSNGWNNQSDSGCIIENAILDNCSLSSSVSLKLTNNAIDGNVNVINSFIANNIITNGLNVGGSSIVTGNTITNFLLAKTSTIALNNTVMGEITVKGVSTISNNTISGGVTLEDASTASNNIIDGEVNVKSGTISYNTILGGIRGGGESTLIHFNDIKGGVIISNGPTIVANNTIQGEDIAINLSPHNYVHLEVTVANNTITARDIGVNIIPTQNVFLYMGWSTRAHIYGNTIQDCKTAGIQVGEARAQSGRKPISNNVTIKNNLIINNYYAIDNKGGSIIIEGNTVLDNYCGINKASRIKNNVIANNTVGISWSSIIEKNLIINNQIGIKQSGEAKNNTVANNTVGIEGGQGIVVWEEDSANNTRRIESISLTLIYNNIYGNMLNFNYTPSADGNAAYNWWGTANQQAIGQTIYDYKNDFLLGRVNYTPFLEEPNPQAMPDSNVPIDTPISLATPTITLTPIQPSTLTPTPTLTSIPTQSNILTQSVTPIQSANPTGLPTQSFSSDINLHQQEIERLQTSLTITAVAIVVLLIIIVTLMLKIRK